ncbi:NB-ARC domain-containing protein [Curtobacterium sp. BH-2-1-1]|uniref:NB-ARC domain-containing protein n=1 Tax=Curtobacterium sp. BH-2-1-1 TaxID=1905847 RepID=UPI002156060C|nr:NB-ARC domain-containing protein [Curtobacterium sp. BH-2-1-1]
MLLQLGRTRDTNDSAPSSVDDFTARDAEVARILQRAKDAPTSLITVSGGPGVGKTALAAEALHRRGGGWVHVDLAGQTSAPLSALEVVRRLITLASRGADEPPASLEAALATWRAVSARYGRPVLLDDAADESQVRLAIDSSEATAPIVVTSRRLLAGLDADLRIAVAPLSHVDSLALLLRIAPDAADSTSLSALVDRCAGIPLALRVAGLRVSAPGVDADSFLHAMELEEQHLSALQTEAISVEATFAVSYRQLPQLTSRVFRSLSVIDGTTFDATIGAAPLGIRVDEAEDALEELVDFGLLEPRAGNRYHLHDLLRAFAASRLQIGNGKESAAQCRVRLHQSVVDTLRAAAGWFAPTGHPAASSVFSGAAPARAWIVTESDHWWAAFNALRTSQEREAPRSVVHLAAELQWFSNLWPAWGHWYELFEAGAEIARAIGDLEAASRLLGLQTWAALMERGDREGALLLATAALNDASVTHNDAVIANAEYHVAWAHLALRQPELALPHIDAAIEGNKRSGDDEALVQCRSMAGAALHLLGRHDEAITSFRAVLQDLERAADGDPGTAFSRVVAYEEIAKSANALGRWREAMDAAGAGMEIADAMSWDTGSARALRQRAEAALGAGMAEEAEDDVRRAVELVDASRGDAQALAVLDDLGQLAERAANLRTQAS